MPTQTYDDLRTVLVEKPEPRIGVLTFNRPEKRNSIAPEFSREMNIVLDRILYDDEIRVLIVTGKGTAFCAGMDLKVFSEFRDNPSGYERPGEGAMDWFMKLRHFTKPTIAAINGHAYGGGFMTAALCDLSIAADSARVGLSEINWGGPPGGGATLAALDFLPLKHANYLLFTGEAIDGPEMKRIGWVNDSVPLDQLMERSLGIARQIAKHHPTALKWLKIQVLGSRDIPSYDVRAAFSHNILAQMQVQDAYTGHHEGWKQFADKTYKPGIETLDYADDPSGRQATGLR